jgi:hypothetical protein
MRFQLMMRNPHGEIVSVPLATGLMDNPYKLLGICRERQDLYGPGYKFWVEPL